jgi:hypothetical protein
MKSTLLTASLIATTFLAANHATAGTMTKENHTKVLNELVGKLGPVNIDENRTFFFSNFSNEVITVTNSATDLSVTLTDNNEDFGVSLAGANSDQTVVTENKDKQKVLTETESIKFEGKNETYSIRKLTLKSEGRKDWLKLSAEGTDTVFFKYDATDADSKKWGERRLKKPETKSYKTEATFILSLTDKEMSDLGLIAKDKVQEERTPELNGCTLDGSGYLLRCDYSLPTDYTPDTLHTIFSIKNGKVSELLDVNIEPGC